MIEDPVDDDGQRCEGDIVHGEGQAVIHTLEEVTKGRKMEYRSDAGMRGTEERGVGGDNLFMLTRGCVYMHLKLSQR